MRVCLQYFFQGWGFRGPDRYKDMILNTGTEEIGHIEMLATAVALNLEGAAMPVDSNGNPFNGSWVVATGNLAADMHASVNAEGAGRLLATRLYEMTPA